VSPDPEAIRIFDPSQFVEDYDERYGNIGCGVLSMGLQN
jgi:hypothetical protein